jgi:hypothetical protein
VNEAAYHAILRRLGVEPIGTGRPAPPASELELARRTSAFRQQLAEWTASGRLGAPVFSLPGLVVTLGRCVGCGEMLAEGGVWRCPTCLRAVEQVLGLSPLEDPAP